MSARRNLWCGLWAWESGLINTGQLVEACKVWAATKTQPLEDYFVEREWVRRRDRDLLRDQLAVRAGGDLALADAEGVFAWPTIPDHLKRLLSAIDDDEFKAAVSNVPSTGGAIDTVILAPDEYAAPDTPSADLKHETNSRYTLASLHASGGMGHVWLARDEQIGRDVALKELRAELSNVETLSERFLREARITGQLEHPGIIPVYELGHHPDGQVFYTMRYMRGRTLTKACSEYHSRHAAGEDDPLELVQLLSAFISVCNTVAYAHSHGIVHRDLKGENVVLGDFGEVVVLDWGLAKRLSDPPEERGSASHEEQLAELPEHAHHTVMGQIIGTPGYMAPEQADGRLDLIGPHTDIFGLGAMLYELLTGKAPFAGTNTIDVIRKTKRGDFLPPRAVRDDVPPALEAACLKALSTDPAQRHKLASDLGREVQGWQDKQRRIAEQALAQSRKLLQAMVDNSPEIMFAKDLEGRYILINRWYETTFNVDRATFIGQTDFGLFPVESAEQYRANDRKVLESGETLIVEESDENHIWTSVKFPILDLQGKPCGVGGMSCDVTALRKLERDHAASQAQCQALLAACPTPLMTFDAEGRVTAGNVPGLHALAPTAADPIGRPCLELGWQADSTPPAEFTAASHPVLEVLRTARPSWLHIHAAAGSGERWLVTLEPMLAADGRAIGVAASAAAPPC